MQNPRRLATARSWLGRVMRPGRSRALVALLLLASLVEGVAVSARGGECRRTTHAVATAADAASAPVGLVAPSHEHDASLPDAGAPVIPPGCGSTLALPARASAGRIVVAQASPGDGPAGRLTVRDPSPPFRPPRVS